MRGVNQRPVVNVMSVLVVDVVVVVVVVDTPETSTEKNRGARKQGDCHLLLFEIEQAGQNSSDSLQPRQTG